MEEESIDKEVEEVIKIQIQDLPVEVRDYLVGFFDYSTRRKCRLVSHYFKESVDGIGISIKIDDRKPESIAFSKEVNCTEVHVQQILEPSLNLNTKKWRTVMLSGPMVDSVWLNNSLLRNCPNLRVLFLDGICLICRNFGEPLRNPPVFEHLTQIHCYYSNVYFACPRQETRRMLRETDFYTQVDQNMEFLLGSIRSRVLKVLSVYISHEKHAPERSIACWENSALLAFVESHRKTLEELNGASPDLDRPIDGVPRIYQVPAHLKQLFWNVVPTTWDETPAFRNVAPPFWKDVLLAQVSLERLRLEFADVYTDVAAYCLLLKTVFHNNARTLAIIHLYIMDEDTGGVVIDMSMFSSLELLQKLAITFADEYQISNAILINLNLLPRTRLTFLVLIGPCIADDFDGIAFMDGFRPEVLTLKFLSTSSGLLSNQDYMANFLKLVLRCRSLNQLDLGIHPPNISIENPELTTIDEEDIIVAHRGKSTLRRGRFSGILQQLHTQTRQISHLS